MQDIPAIDNASIEELRTDVVTESYPFGINSQKSIPELQKILKTYRTALPRLSELASFWKKSTLGSVLTACVSLLIIAKMDMNNRLIFAACVLIYLLAIPLFLYSSYMWYRKNHAYRNALFIGDAYSELIRVKQKMQK